jgi:protocatechuate 3,4-dioxygenase beta subunit
MFLGVGLAVPAAAVGGRLVRAAQLPAEFFEGQKPCDPNEKLTPAVPAGGDFKAKSPERASLREAGVTGTPLVIAGQVSGIRCGFVKGAVLDFWQADARGQYDAAAFRLRGRQTTDAQGRYKLETIVPGAVGPHAKCIHVKVQPPKGAALTTAIFFAGDARNEKETGFQKSLVVTLTDTPAGKRGTFDFVIDL